MKSQYRIFNAVCIFLIVGSLFGTFLVSRASIRNWWYSRGATDVPIARSRAEMQKQVPPTLRAQAPSSTQASVISVTSTPPSVSSSPEIASTTVTVPEKPLPPEINLAVPFVPQAPEKNWDQPWQDACEEAAILMMKAYYEDTTTSIAWDKEQIINMIQWEEEQDWGLSIEIEKIQKIFTDFLKLSHTTKIIQNPTVEQLKKYLANGQPVYVVAAGKILPNPHFQNGGPEYHALVIRGYTEDSFITNDPGTQFGENFKYKYDDLMNAIRDWNGGEVMSGRRVVLVVE